MSNTENVPSPPPGPSPTPRSGWLTAIMAIIGVILLLPGVCGLLFGGGFLFMEGRIPPSIMVLVSLGLLVGAGGVFLIRAAIRRRKR